jgi:tetratricopeptide (TPR) repeat protein
MKGNIYYDAQKFALAIDAYNNILLNSPGNRDARINRADAMVSNLQYEDAITEYKLLQKSDSQNPELYFNIAFCELQLSQNENAILNFTKALDKDYENLGLLLMLRGVGYNNLKMQAEACADWRKSKELGCKDTEAYLLSYCK